MGINTISEAQPNRRKTVDIMKPDSAPFIFLKKYSFIFALLAIITTLHYSQESRIHQLHGVYRLFFFLPIILGGFRGGKAGGLMVSLLVAASIYPHAFVATCSACGSTTDKFIELALYLGVGVLTGTLSDRIIKARNELRHSLAEKTAMEAKLLRSTRLAAVGRLSAGLAHEIRNPLASIQGSAELLADDFDTDHPKGRMLSILLDEAKRLNSVLTRFLEFARNEPGEQSIFNLVIEVTNIAEMIRHHPDYSKVTCDVITPEDEHLCMGNREQIRQVLLNLGLNAAAACSPTGKVTFQLVKEGDYSRCAVSDTGPGFTQEALEQFGTPFFSTKPKGTGLGLATSLKIMQDQGGSLEPGIVETGGLVIMMVPTARKSL